MADSDIYVPDEILDNILVRLPTKSLTRFRCVSKHWNRLISNPDFMKSLQRREIFLLCQSASCLTIEKVVSGENIIVGYRMVRAHSPKLQVARLVTVGGTTNGLVLLVLDELFSATTMMLYNPLTRVLKKVPNPPYILKYDSLKAFGLGHGATQDDLKIVTFRVSNGPRSSLSWGVFSVKDQSWSAMTECSRYYPFSTQAGIFVNGFLYWSVDKVRFEGFSMSSIIALDIMEMKLLEIEIPYDRSYVTTLGTINGCLCLILTTGVFDGYELLVMKDHGIWESCSIGCSTSTVRSILMKYDTFSVMCILDEGKVILKNRKNNTLVIVDLVKDSSEPILVCTGYNPSYAIEYVESFCNI